MSDRILYGDNRQKLKELPDNSVQCVVTSPPYWSLRSYLPAGHPMKKFEIGSEPTIELYIEALMAVFREVHRILRPDGTFWLNIGDSATSGGRRTYDENEISKTSICKNRAAGVQRPAMPKGLKPKDIAGIPWRVAFALQGFAVVPIDDLAKLCRAIDARDLPALDAFRAGFLLYEALASMKWFWLRMDNIWHKPNPMPDSTKDRPTRAHEYLFLLTKSKHYFYDPEPIREPLATNTLTTFGHARKVPDYASQDLKLVKSHRINATMSTRTPRMNEDGTIAGTSEKGACAQCGAPWLRIVKVGSPDLYWQQQCGGDANGEYNGTAVKDYAAQKAQNASLVKQRILAGMKKRKTAGWEPSCTCFGKFVIRQKKVEVVDKKGKKKIKIKSFRVYLSNGQPHPTVPCLVMDPFVGTGTAGKVAKELGRDFVGCDLDPRSVELAEANTAQDNLPLIAQ